jgi:hypothetical protein
MFRKLKQIFAFRKNPGKNGHDLYIGDRQSYKARAGAFIKGLERSYRQGRNAGGKFDSMTTSNELVFLDHYGRDFYFGRGKIVDLGCWLGATTAALADGLLQSPRSKGRHNIESFDLFQWDEWMNPIKEAIGAKVDFVAGQCFYDHVRTNLGRYSDLVAVHKADLSVYRPPEEWKIEFIFVDAMKNWELARSIAANFFPKLIPGESLVVQQDFAFNDPIVSTNHLLMWHLRDYFEPLHHVPHSCSMVFLTRKTPDARDIPAYTHDFFGPEEVEEAYRYCLPMIQESMRPALLVAKLCHGLMCYQEATVFSALKQLETHKLPRNMQETVLRCMAQGYGTPPPGWDAVVAGLQTRIAACASQ